MRCRICGSHLRAAVTDLPFKRAEKTIVIVKDLPVLQCENCTEYSLEDSVRKSFDTPPETGNGDNSEIRERVGMSVASNSSIEWTDSTWNPVTGCTKISPGCKHCYAERMAKRLEAMSQARYRNGFEVTLQPDLVRLPLRWRQPRTIFVNSMSDLFHEDIPESFIADVFQTMVAAHWHTFQILTKRASRLAELSSGLPWPINVWMGVSVESPRYLSRIDHLRKVPAAVRFLSVEPLLARIPSLPLGGIDWVIVGGESGPGCRPMAVDWVREIRDHCVAEGVPFFFKQWGGTRKGRTGRLLDGRTWDEMPQPVLRWRPSGAPCLADAHPIPPAQAGVLSF